MIGPFFAPTVASPPGTMLISRPKAFEAAHAYRGEGFGRARRVHGHNYVLTATIAGRIDPDTHFVLARVVDHYARRPQIQERMTEQVMSLLRRRLAPQGAMVVLEARHLCMEMRGVRKAGAVTTTSAIHGVFEDDRVRQEFLALIPRARA